MCSQNICFPELPALATRFFRIARSEELTFWILAALLLLPSLAPFASKDAIYGFRPHLFVLAHIVESSFKHSVGHSEEDFLVDAIKELALMKDELVHVYDVFVVVLGDVRVGWLGWTVQSGDISIGSQGKECELQHAKCANVCLKRQNT